MDVFLSQFKLLYLLSRPATKMLPKIHRSHRGLLYCLRFPWRSFLAHYVQRYRRLLLFLSHLCKLRGTSHHGSRALSAWPNTTLTIWMNKCRERNIDPILNVYFNTASWITKSYHHRHISICFSPPPPPHFYCLPPPHFCYFSPPPPHFCRFCAAPPPHKNNSMW